MPIDDPAARAAYQKYWGPISESARLGLSSTDMWQLIRGASEAAGLASPGVSASAVSVVRGIAGRMQRAADALMGSPADMPVDASMISVAPWSRSADRMEATSQYQIRFLSTIDTAEGEKQVWRSIMLPGLPTSHADVLAKIDEAAGAFETGFETGGGSFGGQFVNLDEYILLAV